jgi:nickel transport protein
LAVLATPGAARAHRLEVEATVLPGQQKVRIESWFDLSGDSAMGAKVEVFRPDGRLLTQGRLNDQGIFAFAFEKLEPLRVIVSAGAGHRKELTIPEVDLKAGLAAGTTEPSHSALTGTSDPSPHADRSSRVSPKDVLAGVGFLLALAAFVLSVRNARQLREPNQRAKEPRGTAFPMNRG